jgi:galactose mutarotase-like enzyme
MAGVNWSSDESEVHLTDPDTGAVATIVPARGGMVTRFDVGDRRVLFLDEATLRDPTKNVRGGVPVLFPTPGKLEGDRWAHGGHGGALKQHGFARNLPWRVVSTLSEGALAAVALRLESSDATRAAWPWDFCFDITYTLRGHTLALLLRVENRGAEPMPFGVGFHPYFFVAEADKPHLRVDTAATRAFDNVTKREAAVALDLTGAEVDLHLLDHERSDSALVWPDGRRVRLVGSPEFSHWVIWTLAGRDFVCLEPWTCPGDALNRGHRLLTVAPGEARALALTIDA